MKAELDIANYERQSMNMAMAGSLFMGGSGVCAGIMAHSGALVMDGLFSTIGFVSGLCGMIISRRLSKAPDKYRPFGYAAEESLFTTFRAMTTLGLILWAIVSSASGIYNYVIRGEAELLIYGPAFIYIAVISTICFSLWALHYRNWDRTGRRSEILRLEAKAAAFDGILTIVAGGGIVAVYLFGDGLLAPVAPIADSIILLVLCLLIIRHFWIDFTMGLAELAGATANASTLQTARIACRPVLNAFDGKVRDFVVLKYGRSYDVVCYLHPKNPISAAEVDEISNNLTTALQDRLPGAHVNILISRRGRAG